MGISTHILDTTRGKPAQGVAVTLERGDGENWTVVGSGTTNADGRVGGLCVEAPEPGRYRIRFEVSTYFEAIDVDGFYPRVDIEFLVRAGAGDHYHVPLLLNPFGYATYRGS
jgi:5-hydroxyisourate hydrolase